MPLTWVSSAVLPAAVLLLACCDGFYFALSFALLMCYVWLVCSLVLASHVGVVLYIFTLGHTAFVKWMYSNSHIHIPNIYLQKKYILWCLQFLHWMKFTRRQIQICQSIKRTPLISDWIFAAAWVYLSIWNTFSANISVRAQILPFIFYSVLGWSVRVHLI